MVPVDALHALGRSKSDLAACLIHAKFGDVDLPRLHQGVLGWAAKIFSRKDWSLRHRRVSPPILLMMIAAQVVDEFIGAPCSACKGRGFMGEVYGHVWHQLKQCGCCSGSGSVRNAARIRETGAGGDARVRQPCPVCGGKKLVAIQHDRPARRTRPCRKCAGIGQLRSSLRTRAKGLDVSHTAIADGWGARLDFVLKTLKLEQLAALRGSGELLQP